MSSLRRRGKGKPWHLCWYDESGRFREKSLKTTDRATAEEFQTEFDRSRYRGELGLPDRKRSWDQFKTEYLAYSNANKAPRTAERDEEALRWFEGAVSPSSVASITPQQIEQWKQKRLAGTSETTVNIDYRHLKAALNKAVEWGYIVKSPMAGVKPFRLMKKPPRFLSQEEIDRLLKSCEDAGKKTLHLMGMVFIFAGLRLNELLHLRWEDVDFGRGYLHVRSWGDFKPKDKEERGIPMDHKLKAEMAAARKDAGVVFGRDGEVMRRRGVQQLFSNAFAAAGISDASVHTLRHTFASHLVMAGVDIRTVMELMGHSSIQTTMIYAHLSKPHLEEAIRRRNPVAVKANCWQVNGPF